MENNDVMDIIKAISDKKIVTLYSIIQNLLGKYEDEGVLYYDFISKLSTIVESCNDFTGEEQNDIENKIQNMFFEIIECVKNENFERLKNLLLSNTNNDINPNPLNEDLTKSSERDEYNKMIESKIAVNKILIDEISKLEKSLSDKIDQLKNIQESEKTKQRIIVELQESVNAKVNEITEYKKTIENNNQKIRKLNDYVGVLEEKTMSLENDNDELEHRVRTLELKNSELKAKCNVIPTQNKVQCDNNYGSVITVALEETNNIVQEDNNIRNSVKKNKTEKIPMLNADKENEVKRSKCHRCCIF